MGLRLLFLPLLLATAAFAEIGEPRPQVEAAEERHFFFTGAVTFPPSLGLKVRANRTEFGCRAGWLPDMWSIDSHVNIYALNPDPENRGTWYGGPEFLYREEVTSGGNFQTGLINGIFGREMRLTPRIRWAWEAGMGIMVYSGFQGAGPPIIFPILPMARAELRYAVL
jgi:hypothetical protein